MKFPITRFIAAGVSAVILFSVAGCGSDATPSAGPGGAFATAGSPASGGVGGRGGSAGGPTGGSSVGAGGSSVGAGGSSAGGGSAGSAAAGGSSVPATFATVKEVVNGGRCSSGLCHGPGGMAPPPPSVSLTLTDDALLYTHLTSYVSVACGNLKLVEPNKPDQSALLKILTGPCGKTGQMPLNCTPGADGDCIPGDYVAAISQWIASGAPE